MARTHKHPKTDPLEGNAESLKKWLGNPKNRNKMYNHDREAAAALGYEPRQETDTKQPQQ